MTDVVRRRLLGHAWALMATSGALLLAAVALESYGLAAYGLALGLVVALGAAAPRDRFASVRFVTDRSDPMEDDAVSLTTVVTSTRPGRLVEWRVNLPDMAVAEGQTAGLLLTSTEATRITTTLRFPLFGLQRLGPMEARAGDPFGFAASTARLGRNLEIRVYPRRPADQDFLIRSRQVRSLLGAYEISQPGDGFEFFALRDYHVGDRPREINWKASARLGTFIVNQREKENHTVLTILLDVRRATRIGQRHLSPFAQGCRAAVALAEAHLRIRDEVRLVAYGESIHEDRHTGASRRMQGVLDLVVGVEPAGDTPLAAATKSVLPRIGRRSPVVIISPLSGDASVAEAVTALRAREAIVSAFVARAPSVYQEDDATARWRSDREASKEAIRALGVRIHEEPDALMAGERARELEVQP
ncbi:MAG: DUF58 domain-containing protein [Euryarchaeota archaeon]|nr:DUF58 domain-containing protein [Euryarchaeota archaeon]